MKLKLITLFPSILLILLLVNACKKRRDEPLPKATALYGKVINKKTGLPIRGAEILFQEHMYYTPASGSYRFEDMAGVYSLVTDHDDYYKDSINIILIGNKDLMKDRPLEPKRSILHVNYEDSLHFESTTDTLIVSIENAGIEDSLVWQAESNRDWLIISPTSGTIYGEGSMQLEITIDIDYLTLEKDTGTITITNGIYGDQSIEVSVCVEKDNIEVVEDPMESLKEGLVAYYPFNGDINDHSGNQFHLTQTGISSYSIDRNGNIASAYSADFSDGYSYLTSNKSVLKELPITISLWFKNRFTFASNDAGFTLPYYGIGLSSLVDNGSTILRNSTASGTNRTVDGLLVYATQLNSDAFTLDEWTYVTVIMEAVNDRCLYINGQKYSQFGYIEGSSQQLSFASGTLNIMNIFPLDGNESGEIDDIRIYNRALTEEEVSLLYNE